MLIPSLISLVFAFKKQKGAKEGYDYALYKSTEGGLDEQKEDPLPRKSSDKCSLSPYQERDLQKCLTCPSFIRNIKSREGEADSILQDSITVAFLIKVELGPFLSGLSYKDDSTFLLT